MINDEIFSELLSNATIEIQEQKQAILIEKVKEIDHTFNMEEESKRRFKRIVCESELLEGIETWFWNDGTHTGKRIVTFKTRKDDLSIRERNTIDLGIDYY